MKRVYLIALIILVTLPAAAQFEPVRQSAPAMSFQSTSTMMGSGSAYSSNPMLSADGTATYETASNGPRRAKKDEGDDEIGIITPGQGGTQAPIGDALIPLLLMAMAYVMFILLRRRKSCI